MLIKLIAHRYSTNSAWHKFVKENPGYHKVELGADDGNYTEVKGEIANKWIRVIWPDNIDDEVVDFYNHNFKTVTPLDIVKERLK